MDVLKKLAADSKVIAIGETGLDYYYSHSPHDVQRRVFGQFIHMARQTQLPIVVHERDAARDATELLRCQGAGDLRGVIHCFTGNYESARAYLDLGFYLFRGGMKPHGLGKERDRQLNAALGAALQSISDAAQAMGAKAEEARMLTVDTFAHAAGLLLLAHTGRIRMFGASARDLMARYVEDRIDQLKGR